MVRYRRHKLDSDDAMFFITAVAFDRKPILETNFGLLKAVIGRVRAKYGFETYAFAFLPDHFHLILRPRGADYSKVIYSIKRGFSYEMKRRGLHKERANLWQSRFWEHTIRDEEDLIRHTDYTHYNPVKHGLVTNPNGWPHSSFSSFVRRGVYSPKWGTLLPASIVDMEFE